MRKQISDLFCPATNLVWCLLLLTGYGPSLKYRSRATISHSRLVAAPLNFQAKNRFYVLFMW